MKDLLKRVLISCLCFFMQLVWRVRYKVTYRGLDEIKEKLSTETNGVLFLPNHPAIVIDPLLVTLSLLPDFQVRPLIVEYMFYHPVIHWVARLINALPVPNFHTGFNTIKQRRTEKMLGKVSEGLKNGSRFLIYPSGTTKQGPREVIGGAFGVHQLITENPTVQVVLVRMTGLWGSMFSRALSKGDVPEMNRILKKSLWIILKNLIFFVPKREIVLEFELAGSLFPRHSSKSELNHYLEEWYNRPFQSHDGRENFGEPLTLVSYAFWKLQLPQIAQTLEERIELSMVPENIKEQVIVKIAELSKRQKESILPSQQLLADLGLDSLDLADLVAFLEEHFDVSNIQPGELTTVSRVFLIAMKLYQKPEVVEREWNLRRWHAKLPFARLAITEGDTIPDRFLSMCDQKLFDVAAADPRSGVLSYRKIKMKVLLLSEKIRLLPGDRIGILLPSTVTVEVVILATLFAGKTPVMINWTIGGRHLDTVVEVSQIEKVITSWSFLDTLENVDISRIEEMLVVLEELKVEFSLLDMIKAEGLSLLPRSKLLACSRFAHLIKLRKQEAVILFTSGTEAMPKGVVLSHKNLLSNQRAVLQAIELTSDDKLLAMLPPFHSFGFAITGLMPLLSGMRVVYYPNPTDSKRLAKAIKTWGVTVVASAPTFLKNILQTADCEQLATVRLVVSGAEKAPQELFGLSNKLGLNAQLVEGYGITECAPVLTLNNENRREYGVGRPIPGVELKVVDPDTHSPLKENEVGLILAAGPNVFSGYLNPGDGAPPFLAIGGSRWYVTGDLGKIDQEGHLILAGRLKRFVKVGGEMLSLAAIEEALSSKIMERELMSKSIAIEGPQFALCASNEENGRPKLTLFTTYPFELLEVNQILRQKGFSNLVKIDSVNILDAIPVTATGKVAYRILEKMLQKS